jgi:hypothetical protein
MSMGMKFENPRISAHFYSWILKFHPKPFRSNVAYPFFLAYPFLFENSPRHEHLRNKEHFFHPDSWPKEFAFLETNGVCLFSKSIGQDLILFVNFHRSPFVVTFCIPIPLFENSPSHERLRNNISFTLTRDPKSLQLLNLLSSQNQSVK